LTKGDYNHTAGICPCLDQTRSQMR